MQHEPIAEAQEGCAQHQHLAYWVPYKGGASLDLHVTHYINPMSLS